MKHQYDPPPAHLGDPLNIYEYRLIGTIEHEGTIWASSQEHAHQQIEKMLEDGRLERILPAAIADPNIEWEIA